MTSTIRNQFLVTLLLISFFSLNAQENDLKRMKLNDQIKTIHETFFKASLQNDEVKKSKPRYSYINEFNKKGNKTADKRLNASGNLVKKYVYTYEHGKRTMQKQFNADDSLIR
ncbi:MAG TPA: hypothetical protein VJ946_08105, partial [Bacteroidales bacterium]|nr:hypothetical protein [Bacteroidales bacterium]